MKKILSFLLMFVLILGTNSKVFALTKDNNLMQIYSHEEIANFNVENTSTYEEVLTDMKANGLATQKDIDDFKESHNRNVSVLVAGYVKYAKFTMPSYSFIHGLIKLQYVLTPVFYVGLYYTVGPEPDKMVSLDDAHIQTSNGTACKFVGNIFYRLESGRSFYYGVYGDVYKTATITYSGGGQIGVGQSATVTFGASYTNNYIRNVDFDDRYYTPALNP